MSAMDREKLGELLSAYLDDELSSRETALVQRVLDENEDARLLLDELRETAELVSALPRHRAPSSIAADVQSQLERSELLADVTQTAPVSSAGRGPMRALLSMAAALVFVIGGAWFLSGTGRWGSRTSPQQVARAPFEDVDGALESVNDEGRELSVGREPSAVSRRSTSRGRRDEKRTAAKPVDMQEPGKWVGDSEANTLVATADIESKLAAGMSVSSVQGHAFVNEPVRLRVNVRNAAERDSAMRRLTALLQSQGAVNLGAQAKSTAKQDVSAAGYYYRGDPLVNFSDPRQRQVLVRTSPRDLGRTVGELSSAVGRDDAFVLTSGPLTVRGARRVKIAVSGLGESSGSSKHGSAGRLAVAEESAGREADDTSDLLDEVAKTFNLDPSVFAAAKDVTSREGAGKTGSGGPDAAKRESESGPPTPTVADGSVADADTEADRGELSRSAATASDEADSKLAARPTLVERRRERLERMRLRRTTKGLSGDSGNRVSAETKSPSRSLTLSPETIEPEALQEQDEVYVTLVVEFVIAGSVKAESKAKARAAPPANAPNKSSEPDTPQ